jgi:predicted HicB family RNase H-like nuclease
MDCHLHAEDGRVSPESLLPPDKEYSGKSMLRVDPELHKALAINSVKEGKSLNACVAEKLRKS